ncbi:MAG TPA: amidohydrolase family protein [Steroidobacteraceae bacterium]|nr:amidohydrolase family protein [Steroidobacteraceae bacterium]
MTIRFRLGLALSCAVAAAACSHPTLRVTSDKPVALAALPVAPDSGTLAIHCGTLIDGVSDQPAKDVTIVIHDGRITSVQTLVQVSATLPTLELGEYTCLPGLIDMHTHLTDRAPDARDLSLYFRRSAAETRRISAENAAVTLQAGFTSARNVGTYLAWSDRTLRDAINRGEVAGPRMQICGYYLTIPHGGGDLFVPGYQEPADSARFHAGVARNPEEFRRKAQEAVAGGADLLKVIASGAVLAYGGVPGDREMQPGDIAAVVEVAHAAGIRVAAHAHGAQSIKDAILAGVDTIEHASLIDEEGIRLARERHVALSMDVYDGDYIDTEGRRQHWPEEFLRKNIETTEIQRVNFSRAHAAGVDIVFGTDAAVYPHGLNARQFPIMVERGMTPMQAIQSATSLAARYMGWPDRVGQVSAGHFGDVIAVKGDPLKDISLLKNVAVVVKGGLVFKLPRP